MLSLTSFAQLLLAHDWFYDRADDRRAYLQGQNERTWLVQVSRQSEDHAALYRRAFYLHR